MVLFINGEIYTQSGMCQGFVVKDNTFVYVGTNEGACDYVENHKKLYPENDVEIVDLQGKFVCAGFNDSHMHLLGFGYTMNNADLTVCTRSISGLIEGFKQWYESHPLAEGQWICGRGFNQDYFEDEHRLLNRYDLDKVCDHIPVVAVRACGHMCVVNSAALAALGLDGYYENKNNENYVNLGVEGGAVDIDEHGRLLGIFRENALNLVYDSMPGYTLDAVKQMLENASKKVNSYGVTSVQPDDFLSVSSVNDKMVRQAYKELVDEGRLTVRVNEQCQFVGPDELKSFLEEVCVDGKYTQPGDTWFKCGPLKILGDGSLGARTACMLEPYVDDPTTSGIEVYKYDVLKEMIFTAQMCGMPICIHAIGDGMTENVVNAYAEVFSGMEFNPNHRCGIVHCQIMTPKHYEMFKHWKLHAYIQSIFLDYDIRIVEQRVGKERAASSYNYKRYLDMGISMSNGSDCPVELPIPLRGIQCAVTRQSLDGKYGPYLPDQALSVKQALDSYTIGGAYASFEEDIKGDITAGMLADFVILENNPFNVHVMELGNIAVKQTWIDGRLVYEA